MTVTMLLNSDGARAFGSQEVDPLADLSPAKALLLQLARATVPAAGVPRLRRACARIQDWPEFRQLAAERFASPIAYRNLSRCARSSVPAGALDALREDAFRFAANSIAIVDALRELVEEVLRPNAIPYVCFKGPAIAAQFYGSIGERPFRDVDIIVPKARRLETIERALARGYRLRDPAQIHSPRDVSAVDQYADVASLVSPRGVAVELHRHLHKAGRFYRAFDPFAHLATVDVAGTELATFDPAAHLVYLCYHHTRHRWAHMHWLADLDGAVRHVGLDWQRVERHARDVGLAETVSACLALHDLLHGSGGNRSANGASLHHHRADPIAEPARLHAQEILRSCVASLDGGRAAELAYREQNPNADVAYPWQQPGRLAGRTIVGHGLERFKPTILDYEALPIAQRWRGLYWLTRPWRAGFTKLRRIGAKDAR